MYAMSFLMTLLFVVFSYVTTAMKALRLVLKNFSSVIRSNISAPPSIGVDMAREER